MKDPSGLRQTQAQDALAEVQETLEVNIEGVRGHVEGVLNVSLRCKVVDLIGSHLLNRLLHKVRVRNIAIVQIDKIAILLSRATRMPRLDLSFQPLQYG